MTSNLNTRANSGQGALSANSRILLNISLIVISFIWTSNTFAGTKFVSLTTTKALYSPGAIVNFSGTFNQSQSGVYLTVKYYHLTTLITTTTVNFTGTSTSWSWTTPSTNNQGYLVSAVLMSGSTVLDTATVGVNVASNFNYFPIYGFLSDFSSKTDYQMDSLMNIINRYHINLLQYYDWMDTHHKPLAGTPTSPSLTWNNLSNKLTYFNTIKGYIDRGHTNYNMSSMFYDLIYGSYSNVTFDPSWYLYTTSAHTTHWSVSMPAGWETPNIYMMNPNNTNWSSYYMSNITDVFNATNLHFDGWHIDQLGDYGYMYDSSGATVDVASTFPTVIQTVKNNNLGKLVTMNAVNTYGQSLIATKPVELLYTEMWDGNQTYQSFATVIQANEGYNSALKNIFAAYVGRSNSGSTGTQSDGAVLLADATIFALGGAHIEMGEHMLCNEYFPNSNLAMSATLLKTLPAYYDFMVAYENILRDGRHFNGVTLSGTDAQYWPPVLGKVATLSVGWGNDIVFQCLNYTNAGTLNWQDSQPTPTVKKNMSFSFPCTATVNKLWYASPDFNKGLPQTLSFTQGGGVVTFTLPKIQYWDMIVAETNAAAPSAVTSFTTSDFAVTDKPATVETEPFYKNYPNPFKSSTTITYNNPVKQHVKIEIYNQSGLKIVTAYDGIADEGTQSLNVDLNKFSRGIFVCVKTTSSDTKVLKLMKY